MSERHSAADTSQTGVTQHHAAALGAPGLAEFLLDISDAVSGTLDLDTILSRVASITRRVLDYQIFAILLVNERSADMRIRFAVGHLPEVVENVRVGIGQGLTGAAAQNMATVRVNDVSADPRYIPALPGIGSEVAVPIIWNKQVIGVIDVQSLHKNSFTEEHQRALELVASRIANAIENAKLYRNAVAREKTLALLNDISREMTAILSLDELLTRTAEMVRRVIDYHLFSVLLLNRRTNKLEHRASVRLGENIQIKHDIPLDKGLVGAAATERKAVVVKDVREDVRYVALNPEIRSELVIPLLYKDEVIGVIDLEHTRKGYYTERHVRTLSTLASQMAIAIANARLYERVRLAESRMEREMKLAQAVQKELLPASAPRMPGLDLAARTVPARELGGDLYDYLPYKSQRLGIALGDVSGKGAGAALYGAMFSGLLRSQQEIQSPGAVLQALNQALLERRIESQFMTLLLGIWHERSRKLVLSNSGLPYPIHCSAAGTHQVRVAGLPLGMLPAAGYDEATVALQPGDLLVMVSDGITETQNGKGEEYGRTRLERLLREAQQQPLAVLLDLLFADVAHFGEHRPAADDRTVVVLRAR